MSKFFVLISLILFHAAAFGAACDSTPTHRHTNPDGSLGGYVADTATVDAEVYLESSASVCDWAQVLAINVDNLKVAPEIFESARIYGRAIIRGDVTISGNAQVYGSAKIEAQNNQKITIKDDSQIYGNSYLTNNARIQGQAQILGNAIVNKNGRVCGKNSVNAKTTISDEFSFCEMPYAHFSASSSSIKNHDTVAFSAASSKSVSGALRYTWYFNNEEENISRDLQKVDHKFTQTRINKVRLLVTDKDGNADRFEKGIFVKPIINKPPVAANVPDVYSTNENALTVNFDGTESSDSDGIIQKYKWDFGDGTSELGAKVTHSFKDIGYYPVILTVTDNEGLEATDLVRIKVNCEFDLNDDSCSKIINHEDRIFPVNDDLIKIQLVPYIGFLNQTITPDQIEMKNMQTKDSVNIGSIAKIKDGSLTIPTKDILKYVKDYTVGYQIILNSLKTENGKIRSSSIKNIFFASGMLSLKNSFNFKINVTIDSDNLKFQKRFDLLPGQVMELRNLPYDAYSLEFSGENYHSTDLIEILPNVITKYIIKAEEKKKSSTE